MDTASTFAEWVRVARGERTLEAWSEILGVAKSTISEWENGHTAPKAKARESLIKACGLDDRTELVVRRLIDRVQLDRVAA